jgi:hypothetical protein
MPDYDSLAWLTTIGGTPRLMTTNKDVPGFFCDPSIQLGAVHAASGLWNADGFGDLVVTEVSSNVMHVFTNGAFGTSDPGLAQFTNNSEAISPVGLQVSPASLSFTWLGDFNADGRADLVTLQNLNTAWAFRQAPTGGVNLHRPIFTDPCTASAIDADTVEFTIAVNASTCPPTATHLELLLFNAVTGPTGSLVLEVVGQTRDRFPVVEGVAPNAFSFQQDAATVTQARVGLVRWIHLEGLTTVELFQPTLFVLAPEDMLGALQQWETTRKAQAPNSSHQHPIPGGGLNYLWRHLTTTPSIPPSFWGNPGGIEEPPDLPPKPPEPPTPPAPPPPAN